MSDESVPYQLRPNKFIDRQLFIDLLSRLVALKGPEKYTYISMGGKFLVDHRAVYRQLGIRSLFSFDGNEETVKRQIFNRPLDDVNCFEMESAGLPSRLDNMTGGDEDGTNLIVWLDFTSPGARRSQLQEAVETMKRLQPGDVLRVTLNANVDTLGKPDEWRSQGYQHPGPFRLDKLKSQLVEFVPTSLTSFSDYEFPEVLAACVGLAAKQAEFARRDLEFIPLLSTSYRDGQRMMTTTCVAAHAGSAGNFLPETITEWNFFSQGWSDVKTIQAPDLSVREKHKIDEHLTKGASEILNELSFLPAPDRRSAINAIESYRKLHRYYPTFSNIDL